jgi:muconolactone delta-isomerase
VRSASCQLLRVEFQKRKSRSAKYAISRANENCAEGRPKSVEEGEIFFKEFIRPTLELCKKLANEEKILAGGPISGTIGLALVVKADSAKELDDLVTSLPVWPRMETAITPLTTFDDRARSIERRLSDSRAKRSAS